MAKLNGVTVIPAIAERILFDGVEFASSEEIPVAGDIIRANYSGYCDIEDGEFFAVKGGESGWYFRDNDNDKRDFDDEYGFGVDSSYFTVFKRIETATAPVVTSQSSAPNALPSAYVIHDGKVYVKEARKASTGEMVILVESSGFAGAKAGDVYTVDKRHRDDDSVYLSNGRFVFDKRYNALIPTDSVTIDVNGEAVEYALEKRKAAKGDAVLYITQVGRKSYDIGAILTAGRDSTDSGHINEIAGGDYGMFPSEYLVLTPKVAAQPQYREVKRKANVGERIRIVSYDPSRHMSPDERVKVGAEFTVKSVDGDGDIWYVKDFELSGIIYYTKGEYVVLEPTTSVKQAAIPAESRLKVGEYAKVIGDGKNRGVFNPHEFPIGEIVKVTGWSDLYADRVRAESIDGRTDWYVHNDDYVRATEAEVAAAKRKNVKVGDYVKITESQSAAPAGTIVKVARIDTGGGMVTYEWNGSRGLLSTKFEPVTPAEAEQARKEAAQKAEQAALEVKWSAIGRKVNEFKAGDIVRILEDGACFSKHKKGDVGTVVKVISDHIEVSTPRESRIGGYVRPDSRYVELLTPVESLFNEAK